MNIGFVGLGRLGLPVATAIASKGHTVYGYDSNQELIERYKQGISGLYEPEMDERLKAADLHFTDLGELVKQSDIVFVAVQTPHPPELDGSVRFNHARKDFDYSYLIQALKDVEDARVVAVISTVLPGTIRRIANSPVAYNPFFIGMGTTIKDFLNPEFVLLGEEHLGTEAGDVLMEFYKPLHDSPILRMTWEEAEMVKMSYNVIIGQKVITANAIMQMCHAIDADCDVVTNALTKATDRLISPKYMKEGLGDGGPCHGRDATALAYLSDRLGLEYNIFDSIMDVREKQLEWLADIIQSAGGPVVIMGRTFKPHTNLTAGSPSVLLANILRERGIQSAFYDPTTDITHPPNVISTYVIATCWPQFQTFAYCPGSIIIDPWGFLNKVEGCELVRIGRRAYG
jgi:UDPglucose 6-dehydrogenase